LNQTGGPFCDQKSRIWLVSTTRRTPVAASDSQNERGNRLLLLIMWLVSLGTSDRQQDITMGLLQFHERLVRIDERGSAIRS